MLTRCPECATTFRLRPEQLAQAHGQVRCGKCGHTFVATEHLLESSAGPSSEPSKGTSPPVDDPNAAPLSIMDFRAPVTRKRFLAGSPTKSPPVREDSAKQEEAVPVEEPEPLRIEFIDASEQEDEPPQAPQLPDLPEAEPELAAASASISHATPPAHEPLESVQAAEPAPVGSPPAISEKERRGQYVEDAAETEDEDETELPDYLGESKPARRWPWAAGVGVLAIALGVQATYDYRTTIAKRNPEWRPAMEAACARLGCRVDLPRDSDLVSIEASDLHPEGEGRLMLAATIKNRAPYLQSYPHLELTLTDVSDQAVARRVFGPADYLPNPSEADAGFRAGSELALKLLLDTPGLSAAGYRVYVFFP